MIVYAGIDEAGYGPMLGPLCVGATVFVLRDHDPADGAPDLWSVLDRAVCRKKRDPQRRIAVDDSKRLKGSNQSRSVHPLLHLERGVLAWLAASAGAADAAGPLPEDCAGVLARLGAEIAPCPWYDSTTPLPLAHTAEELRVAASRLHRALDQTGVMCASLRCETIDAEPLNEGAARAGSKASVNFGAVVRHVDAIWRAWPDAHPRVLVDRQGGRIRYRDELQTAFPDAFIRIVAESETVCRYHLERGGSELTISFAPDSEDRHLPVALASMIAKYVRELTMLRLNRFFSGRLPELKPTAGYVQDARRYLEEIEPVIDEMGVDRHTLVRSV